MSGLVFLFGCAPSARTVTVKEALNRTREITNLMGQSPDAFVPQEDGGILFDFTLPSGASLGVMVGPDGRCSRVAPFSSSVAPQDLSPNDQQMLTHMSRRCAGIK
jgi:hypothetical protein